MKTSYPAIFLAIVMWTVSCGSQDCQAASVRLEIWEEIQQAARDKRIDFLLAISQDTLECIECNHGKSRILKDDFFPNHLHRIQQREEACYGVFSEPFDEVDGFSTRYSVIYTHVGKGAKHQTIYTLLEGEAGYQLLGMMGVP